MCMGLFSLLFLRYEFQNGLCGRPQIWSISINDFVGSFEREMTIVTLMLLSIGVGPHFSLKFSTYSLRVVVAKMTIVPRRAGKQWWGMCDNAARSNRRLEQRT